MAQLGHDLLAEVRQYLSEDVDGWDDAYVQGSLGDEETLTHKLELRALREKTSRAR